MEEINRASVMSIDSIIGLVTTEEDEEEEEEESGRIEMVTSKNERENNSGLWIPLRRWREM